MYKIYLYVHILIMKILVYVFMVYIPAGHIRTRRLMLTVLNILEVESTLNFIIWHGKKRIYSKATGSRDKRGALEDRYTVNSWEAGDSVMRIFTRSSVFQLVF